MKVRFLSPALEELREAVDYYHYALPGLGARFMVEIDAAVARIRLVPHGWTMVSKYSRRCLLKSFPYALLYAVEDEEIVILAVAHLRRDPTHYRDRIR